MSENGRRRTTATWITVVAAGVPFSIWFYGPPWRGVVPDPRNSLGGSWAVGIVAGAVLPLSPRRVAVTPAAVTNG